MAASINDAPLDDLELEDDNYAPEADARPRRRPSGAGHATYRVVARHRGTGSWPVTPRWLWTAERPAATRRTRPRPGHRGHRLGLALKADMLPGWRRPSRS